MKYQQKTDHNSVAIFKAKDTINSWKDVKNAVESAKKREDGEDNDSCSARASCQKIADNISALEAWLELLPDGDYGAVVSGVFKMVVTVKTIFSGIRLRLTVPGRRTRSGCSSHHLPGTSRHTLLGGTCK